MFKQCSKCKLHLSTEEFNLDKKGNLGRASICKSCNKLLNYESDNTKETKCNNCCKIKINSEFYKCKRNKSGLQSICKECQRTAIANSLSKPENYYTKLLNSYKKRHPKSIIMIEVSDLLLLNRLQNNECKITGKPLGHIVDIKKRRDNIWNASIFDLFENNLDVIKKDNICLTCNLCDTISRGYNIKSIDKIYNLFKTIID